MRGKKIYTNILVEYCPDPHCIKNKPSKSDKPSPIVYSPGQYIFRQLEYLFLRQGFSDSYMIIKKKDLLVEVERVKFS